MPRLLSDDDAKEKARLIQDRLNIDPAGNVPVITPKVPSATEELLNKEAISSVEDAAWVSTFEADTDMGDGTAKDQPAAAATMADIHKDVIDLKAGASGLHESTQKASGICFWGPALFSWAIVQSDFTLHTCWIIIAWFCFLSFTHYSPDPFASTILITTYNPPAIAGKGYSDGNGEGWTSAYRVASHINISENNFQFPWVFLHTCAMLGYDSFIHFWMGLTVTFTAQDD